MGNKDLLLDALTKNYHLDEKFIVKNQVDFSTYKSFITLQRGLYKYANLVHNGPGKNKTEEYELNRTKYYEFVKNLNEFLGPVNGFLLLNDTEFILFLFMGFAKRKLTENEQRLGEAKMNFNVFRHRLEMYLAYRIIVQRLKSEDMLELELECLKLSRKEKKRIQRKEARVQIAKDREAKNEKEEVIYKLLFKDHIYVKNILPVIAENESSNRKVALELLKRDGTIESCIVSLLYSEKTKKYYMSKAKFDELRNIGVILCQIIKDISLGGNASSNYYGNLNSESKLHKSGYNVSTIDGLTTVQRREILNRVIVNHLYTPGEVVNLLEWFMSHHGSKKKDMSNAVYKWEEDRDYIIENYFLRK